MQQTTGVAVIATQLAATDRRALSEAWYRALHVASAPPRARTVRARVPLPSEGRPQPVRAASAEGTARAAVPKHAPARAQSPRFAAAERAPDRRAHQPELARRLAAALRRPVPPEGGAQFALRTASGRVRVLVRVDAGRTHVVALCAPGLRERVDRALAHARFALAARGARCEVA